MKPLSLLLSLLISFNCLAQLHGTYKVGANQPAPFNTIKTAVDYINNQGIDARTTFLLEDTVYYENNITVEGFAGLSAENTFTIRPADGVEVHLKAPNSNNSIIIIHHSTYINIDGSWNSSTSNHLYIFSLDENSKRSSGIEIFEDEDTTKYSSHISIKNCNFRGTSGNSTSIRNTITDVDKLPEKTAEYILIDKCYFTNIKHAIELSSSASTISNNVFTNCSSAIYLGNKRQSDIITNNKFVDCMAAIYSISNLSLITNNYIEGGENAYLGIFLYSFFELEDTATIANNSIYGNIQIALRFIKPAIVNLRNNTIALTSPSIKKADDVWNAENHGTSCCLSGSGEKLDIRNNIFCLDNNNLVDACILQLQSPLSGLTLNNNLYYSTRECTLSSTYESSFVFENFQTVEKIEILEKFQNLSEFQTAYPQFSANSKFADPGFVSETDLHITVDNNIGCNLGITTDIEGNSRNANTPDAGAYEYNPTANITQNGSCQLADVQFGISTTSNIASTNWHFGDNQTSTELSPTHVYSSAGNYTVSLDITYNDQSTETIRKEITIYSKPQKPFIIRQ